jgi:hypothetical protein
MQTNKSRTRQALLTLLTLGVVGSLAGFAVFSAFSSTTTNPNNRVTAGTVTLADNDSGAAMYDVSDAKPAQLIEKCIKVTYTGSLDSDVKLYSDSTIGSLGTYLDLTVTPGTQATSTFPDCSGFVADAGGAIFTGTLASFASTHSSYANGLADNPGATTKWVANDAVVYRVRVTVQDNASAAGATTGLHSFKWEARNQ